ncbi:tripartite tricarboxylate transporter TctB family protein [Treponema sp.]|uniref:tripartite tricarboxylate transporter TctB family protein n=1 Tax=Treponema sp. TaxID=166 RepID=UPI0025CFB874|nr:tripartite tricarboxylate transporter TctB family protein [Treponema sp.]MBR4323607.1 tripartite tricarboxylate transporter TctB family protein [Treponema sp.]
MKKANIISAIVGMAVSALAFGYTFTFKKFKNVPVGPEFFPRALALLLFICCLVLLLTNLKTNQRNKEKAPTLSLFNKDMQKAALSLLLIILYAISWNFLGFLIATPIALFAMIFILGKRNYKMMAAVSLGMTALVFCAFKFLLGIEMPLGFIENFM